jgi:2-iminoacetate synthase
MSMATILDKQRLDHDRDIWQQRLEAITPADAQAAIAWRPGHYEVEKLLALVSPAAESYLEQMAGIAHALTLQRFGRTVKLYAPLYLSNHCVNQCRYCGFNAENRFARIRLTLDEAAAEADILASEGFRDLLLVSSEDKSFITTRYLADLASRLRGKFSFISVEIYQMSAEQYRQLFQAGIEGVTLYQETYDRDAYAYYHGGGPKADYDMRLRAPDDMAAANMREIGLGVLLGLADWRIETLAMAEHARHLVKSHWQSHVSFSFPRLRPAVGVTSETFPHLLTDKNLVQMILALRLCFADAGIVLSTREPAHLRDRLVCLGATRMSAGSRTNPGGYGEHRDSTRQFEVSDPRSATEIATMLCEQGLEPVWKDWE